VISLVMITLFLSACLAVVGWIFHTGYKLRN
jgi:ABC-2 type transport system permease protein